MGMREKLIELLEQAEGQTNNDVPSLEQMADYLLDNGVTVQNWIPVTERLPEREKDVLVYDVDNDEMHVWAFFCDADGDGWVDAAGDMRPWLDATHWMPLPKTPEDGGAENA